MCVRSGAPSLRRRNSTGAAAVEFALLVPVFVMLTFGTLTAAVTAWEKIEISQAARDAARFGASYPIERGSDLQAIARVAAAEGGWTSLADVSTRDGGYICVAQVGPTVLRRFATGTPDAGRADCFNDGTRTDVRIQVVIRRNGDVDAVLYRGRPRLQATSSIPYERPL